MLLIITGPTASGKTKIAEEIARTNNGEIISVDSRTVYKDLKIGTGASSNSHDIPYHLVDRIEIGNSFSSYDWVLQARKIVNTSFDRNVQPIICGGTLHYIELYLKGMNSVPKPDPLLRSSLRQKASAEGKDAVFKILQDLDLETSKKVHPNDLGRVIRYIEHIKGSELIPSIPPYSDDHKLLFMDPDRNRLNTSIEDRVSKMIDSGWVDEVKQLLERGHDRNSPGLDSIGYAEIISYLNGEVSLNEAVEVIIKKTKDYSKNQIKWLKRLGPEVIKIKDNTDIKDLINNLNNDY